MTEPFERELAVFSAARQLHAGERAAYLDQTCAGDPALRRRIEELLRADEGAEGFLQKPAPGAQRPEEAAAASAQAPEAAGPGEKAGDRIGHYKLLQQIGEGGCGLVYMAEQEEPVRRRVALKVIKLGMDTKQVIARFEAERQALAMMDHPNIARVFDAGATETGRPFFVMELVRGIKITDYCDERNLSTKERLELFIQVCHAVQHAHQKGIIHRDLKPSNILVASDDGVPVPKVIDFGIAKATQGRLTDQTLFTAFEQFIGTPAYMSPEQAELTMQDVDTRTDIYSLGVLLYELLIGRTPFDTQELLASGLEAMRRTIREVEPAKPSTKLTRELVGDDVRSPHSESGKPKSEAEIRASSRRFLQRKELIRELRGDLDWIVMKCLEKDRARRYETASGLANDVRRHLSCEPVIACPPSRLYEFQKTVRRHKFGFAATGAVIAALLAGLAVSTWLLAQEKAARRRAVAAEIGAESDRKRAVSAEGKATEELWRSYVAQARAARFSDQPGRRFDSLEALRKAAAIRFSPEIRDEAIACLALADLKVRRHIPADFGVFDCSLERYACVLTNTGEVSIRASSDDRELLRLPAPADAGATLSVGKFSHNGRFLPVWYDDDSMRVWDLERLATVLAIPVKVPEESVDFQPDDGRIAVPAPGRLDLYALSPGETNSVFPTPFDSSFVRFDPSGRQFALSYPVDRRVLIMDSRSGATLMVLTNAERIQEIAWHPRSPILAAMGWQIGSLYLWDSATGARIMTLKGHQSTPVNVAFSQQDDILFSSGWDGTRLWHARTGEHLMTYLYQGRLESAGPNGTYGHSSYLKESVELLSFASGREVLRLHAGAEDLERRLLAFSADGRWLAFAAGHVVQVFDTHTTDLLGTLPTGTLQGMVFQRNSESLLVSGDAGLFRWPIRPASRADELSIGPPEAFGIPGASQQAALSENGQVFAAFQGDHVCLFDGKSLQEIGRTGFCGRPVQYRFVSLSPDGTKAATGGWHDVMVRVWDAHTGGLITNLAQPEWKPLGSPYPTFSQNGSGLVIVETEYYRVWDTNSWTAGPRMRRAGRLPAVALLHRSTQLAGPDETQASIELRDLDSGKVVVKLQSPSAKHIDELAISPDDSQIAVGYLNTRELRVWDLRLLREELKGMSMDWAAPPYPPLPAQEHARNSVHFRVRTNSVPQAVPAG
jgi:serine/threonine protein kinase/WD40 repeat protein